MSAPSPALLVFDGDCAFCTSSVETLRRMLPRFPRAVPWQHLDLDEHGLDRADVRDYAWVVTPSHHYAGHLALSALLRVQRGFGHRFAGHLLATPPFSLLGALGYRLIAANRHRLPGGTPACTLELRAEADLSASADGQWALPGLGRDASADARPGRRIPSQ